MTLMENQMKEYEKTRNALTSIASEIERFNETERNKSSNNSESVNVFTEIIACKSKLKQKRLRIHKLKKKLNIACLVARTVITKAKENNIDSPFIEQDNVTNLRNKLEKISNFIHLGYNELKKIRNDCEENPNILVQLNKLIFSCGQYYANYCNELESCQKLIRKNHFLLSKISILESNLQAVTEHVKVLKNQNKRTHQTQQTLSLVETVTKDQDDTNSNISGDTFTIKRNHEIPNHLISLAQLLNDQDILLKDLLSITQELYFP